jgi:ATP-dependent Clp protease ATP-binding subunit ClpA
MRARVSDLIMEAARRSGCSPDNIDDVAFVDYLQKKYNINKDGKLTAERFIEIWINDDLPIAKVLHEIFGVNPFMVEQTSSKKAMENKFAEVGTNLSQQAKKGDFNYLITRELEEKYIRGVLGKKSGKSNLLIIGPSRSGKSKLIRSFTRNQPEKTVIEISPSYLLSQTSLRGELETKIKMVIDSADPDTIFFFDEAHFFFNNDRMNWDISNLLKSALSENPDFQTIFATTPEESKVIKSDPALLNRMHILNLKPINEKLIMSAINATANHLCELHKKTISNELVFQLFKILEHVYPETSLDKFKDLLDLAFALTKLNALTFQELVKVVSLETGKNAEEIINLI